MSPARQPSKLVQPIHFEDLGGTHFERLVFAYHARAYRWHSLEWYGMVGKDGGRDIIGRRVIDSSPGFETVCVLCANWKKLTLAKLKRDIDNALKSSPVLPSKIRAVCGHNVAPTLRKDALAHATSKGIHDCEIWSGTELEEHIRANGESLLRRFVEGEEFPDSPNDLLMFAWGAVPTDDKERLGLLAQAFDRPAFETPIRKESSLPAFRQAIDDTICVLNTGVWQTRNTQVIRRLPSRADFDGQSLKRALKTCESSLIKLRTAFDDLLRSGQIRHCGCGEPDCPTYMLDDAATSLLTTLRQDVLKGWEAAKAEVLRE